MEVDTKKAAALAREIALRKALACHPNDQYGHRQRMFEQVAAKEFCDRVLPEGYAGLTHYASDAVAKP